MPVWLIAVLGTLGYLVIAGIVTGVLWDEDDDSDNGFTVFVGVLWPLALGTAIVAGFVTAVIGGVAVGIRNFRRHYRTRSTSGSN